MKRAIVGRAFRLIEAAAFMFFSGVLLPTWFRMISWSLPELDAELSDREQATCSKLPEAPGMPIIRSDDSALPGRAPRIPRSRQLWAARIVRCGGANGRQDHVAVVAVAGVFHHAVQVR